jgi:hypothetical protein
MTLRSLTTFYILLFCITSVCGCASGLNDRLAIGGSYVSPTFRSDGISGIKTSSQSQHIFSSHASPRAMWTPTQYIAPMDSVVHSNEFTLHAPLKRDAPPRVYGRYPSASDTLTMQATSWMDDLLITIDELGRSFIGTPYAVGFLTVTGQMNKLVLSPRQPWKRTTATSWSSGYPSQPQSTEHEDTTDDK